LKILQASKSGLQMEELGERLGLTRDTVTKYLEVLRVEGRFAITKSAARPTHAEDQRGKWPGKERKNEYRT
jgi:hypothetical protein